jgi:flavoprotein
MHQASEKDFKRNQGGGKCTGACLVLLVNQARFHRCQNRNSCLPDVPQVVVVKSSLLRFLLLLRFLNITIHNNECPCNAYESAKIIKVYYLKS